MTRYGTGFATKNLAERMFRRSLLLIPSQRIRSNRGGI
jgi:hypothetical protein